MRVYGSWNGVIVLVRLCCLKATPGTPGSPSASSARGPGPDKKALRVAQAKARRLVEDDDRRAWRAERELRGKVCVAASACVCCGRLSCFFLLLLQNQAGPDLNALFDTRTILRSSALDNEASSDKVRQLNMFSCVLTICSSATLRVACPAARAGFTTISISKTRRDARTYVFICCFKRYGLM